MPATLRYTCSRSYMFQQAFSNLLASKSRLSPLPYSCRRWSAVEQSSATSDDDFSRTARGVQSVIAMGLCAAVFETTRAVEVDKSTPRLPGPATGLPVWQLLTRTAFAGFRPRCVQLPMGHRGKPVIGIAPSPTLFRSPGELPWLPLLSSRPKTVATRGQFPSSGRSLGCPARGLAASCSPKFFIACFSVGCATRAMSLAK